MAFVTGSGKGMQQYIIPKIREIMRPYFKEIDTDIEDNGKAIDCWKIVEDNRESNNSFWIYTLLLEVRYSGKKQIDKGSYYSPVDKVLEDLTTGFEVSETSIDRELKIARIKLKVTI